MWILADIAVGPTIVFGGLFAGLLLLIPIILVEAVVMWRMKWGSFRLALLDSTIANIISTLIGVAATFLFYNAAYGCEITVSADQTQRAETCGFAISPLLWLVLAAIASIIIEGVVLYYYRKLPARITWDAVIAANVVSYGLLIIGSVVLAMNFS